MPNFVSYDMPVVVGNNSEDGQALGMLEAIVISNDGSTPNAGRTVTVTVTLATGLTVAFGPLALGAGQNIYHPRVQAVAADLSTGITGYYERYALAGKVTITTASGAAGDHTKVRLVTEQ